MGTTLGVFYKDDSMATWANFDDNLPNVSVTDLEINLVDYKIIAGTYGRGAWQCNIPTQSSLENQPFEVLTQQKNQPARCQQQQFAPCGF